MRPLSSLSFNLLLPNMLSPRTFCEQTTKWKLIIISYLPISTLNNQLETCVKFGKKHWVKINAKDKAVSIIHEIHYEV